MCRTIARLFDVSVTDFGANHRELATVRTCSGGEHSKRGCELRAGGRYGRYIRLTRTDQPVIDRAKVKAAERMDGKFVVHSNDDTLGAEDMALGYKQLLRVEQAWRQLKSGLRLRPVYHRAVHRIHAHIALTVIALLLERLASMLARIRGATSATL